MKFQISFCALLVFAISSQALAGQKKPAKHSNHASIKLVKVNKPQRQIAQAPVAKQAVRVAPKQKQKPILVATAQKPLPYSQVKIQNKVIDAGPVATVRDTFPKPKFSSLNRKVASD